MHVVLGVLGKLLERAGLRDVLGPAGERLVDRHGRGEVGLVLRQLVETHSVDVVRDAHGDLLDAGENVELGEHEVGEAVDARRVARDHRVVPTAAARAPRGGAVLVAHIAQALAVLVEKLRGERPLADARRVRLDDADHGVDLGGADAGARAGAARRRVGRGHERVGAVVDVEHRRLAALEEHVLARVDRLVEQERGVGHHRRQGARGTRAARRPPRRP